MREALTFMLAERFLPPCKVPSFTFYDIVLDFVLLDAFEDAENPPSTVVTILGNRWLTQGFKRSVGKSFGSTSSVNRI